MAAGGPQPAKPPTGGLHIAEWSAEFAGTVVLMFFVVAAIDLAFNRGALSRALGADTWRFLFIGAVVGLVVGLIAVSPLGRRSGAHLNPAVTLSFWIRGMVHLHDLAGYVAAQLAGATTGVAIARLILGSKVGSPAVNYGVAHPGHGWGDLRAGIGEAILTAVLVAAIQLTLARARTVRLTPLVAGFVVMILVWQAAAYTGAGLNQARGLASDIIAWSYPSIEVYLIGPTIGAALAAAGLLLFHAWRPLTAKLFHDPSYPCVMATRLPAAPPAP
jgi:aquaporin Z